LHQDSFQYLSKVWPRLKWNDSTSPISWSRVAGHSTIAILEGEQCLVFFTAGVSVLNGTVRGTIGFSADPYNPTLPPTTANPDRVAFFEYQAARLVQPNVSQGQGFWAYTDAYNKKPYAYFSSYKSANDYNHASKLTGRSDCASLNLWPYAETWAGAQGNNRYVNAQSFQIISAGKDGAFGPGTTSAATVYNPGVTSIASNQPGYDDMSNFYDRLLGIPR
jgi:hypothetical protein